MRAINAKNSMIPNLDTAVDVREAVRTRMRSRRISLGFSQADLATRSGVSLGTLKRFERIGEVSLATLLAIADALDALDGFQGLFPPIEARTLDEVERQAQPPKRVRVRRKVS